MTTTSPAHIKAQKRIQSILEKHYLTTTLEAFTPAPNEKYIYDGNEFTHKPYLLDVFATLPKDDCEIHCRHTMIGVEIDGKKGHKTSKHQDVRDKQRTEAIKMGPVYVKINIYRFDTRDLVGRGYVNPKTKRRHSILTDDDILTELGVNCQHA